MAWLLLYTLIFVPPISAPDQRGIPVLNCRPTDRELKIFLAFHAGYDPHTMAVSAEEASRNFINEGPYMRRSSSSVCGFECQVVRRSVKDALRRIENVRVASFEEALKRSVIIDLPLSPNSDQETVSLCQTRMTVKVYPKQVFPRLRTSTDCYRGGNSGDRCIYFTSTCLDKVREGPDYAEGMCRSGRPRPSPGLFNRNLDAFSCDDWVFVDFWSSNDCVCELVKGSKIVSQFPELDRRSSPRESKVDFVCYPPENWAPNIR